MTNRPPFTGIDETPANVGDNVPHEGGGDLPDYGEDLFQRIVDVNWGAGGIGAVFASGDVCCFIRACNIPKPTLDQNWIGLGPIGFTENGDCFSASYAVIRGQPTFLIGGDCYTNFSGGLIMGSHDGFNWQDAGRFPGDAVGDLVWDPRHQRFYAGLFSHACWSSATGIGGWVLVQEDFWSHCPNGYPDGIVGYNPKTNKYIHPADVPSNIIRANCVAYAGGIWMAGGDTVSGSGRSCTASSLDDGNTWQVVSSGDLGQTEDFGVVAMVAAPKEDF